MLGRGGGTGMGREGGLGLWVWVQRVQGPVRSRLKKCGSVTTTTRMNLDAQ
jgi:hypothetical protein